MREGFAGKRLLQVQVPEELKKQLREKSKRLNVNVSSFVRMVLSKTIQAEKTSK